MSVSFSTIVQKARLLPTHSIGKQLDKAIQLVPPTVVSPLSNGFRVASESNPASQFATVGVWISSGSRYEQRETQGVSKVLERCNLIATTNQSKNQIQRSLDELGGLLHAKTGRDHTYYYVKCHKSRVNQAVGFLADIVRNGRCSDEDLQEAKKAAIDRRKSLDEQPDELVHENLHVCAYDSTSEGLGGHSYGTEDTIQSLSKDQVVEFRNKHTTAPRCVLVGAGGVEHSQLEAAAKQYFGDLPNVNNKGKLSSRYVGGDLRFWNARMKMFHFAWAFETCGASSGDTVPLQLCQAVYGPFHRSQFELGQHAMHRVLRMYAALEHSGVGHAHMPEPGLETVTPFSHFYEDSGLQGMYIVGRPCQTGPEDASTLYGYLQYTMQEYCRPAQRGVHEQELDQAKVNMKAQAIFNMDGSTNTAEDIGRQVLYYGRRVPLSELYTRIDDVTPVNVMETMHHYYYSRRPVLSAYGFLSPLPGYEVISTWTWRFWS